MASTFACLGLDVVDTSEEFDRFVLGLAGEAVPIGLWQDLTVSRWQDPSGVRLTFALRGQQVLDFVPGFDGPAGTTFSGFAEVNEEVVSVRVDDEYGEQVTGMTVELEERRLLPAWPDLVAPVAVSALGVDVATFADEAAFAASDASLLSPERDTDDPVPEHWTGPWPPRVGAQSFFSYGVFAQAADADAHARLSGTVASCERRVVARTGRPFLLCRVESAGFAVNLCLPDSAYEPAPGQVVSGTVWLSASLTQPPPLPPVPRQRWWRRG